MNVFYMPSDATGFGRQITNQSCFKLEVFMETVRDLYIYYVHLNKYFHNFNRSTLKQA